MNVLTKRALLITVATVFAVTTPSANAEVITTVTESGGNVIFSGSGSLNIDDLVFEEASELLMNGFIEPASGTLAVNPGLLDVYTLPNAPTPYGTGTSTNIDNVNSTGDTVALQGIDVFGGPDLYVPRGYTSGSPCLLYTSPSPRDLSTSRMPSSA